MAVVGFSLRFDLSIPKSPLHVALPRTSVNYETLPPILRQSQRVRSSSSPSPPNESKEDEEVKDLGVKAALSMLKFYKREISPLLLRSCRYVPTCSEYSMEAYKKYGFGKGTILMAWRLCRCNPLGGSGFDPPRWFDEEKPSDH